MTSSYLYRREFALAVALCCSASVSPAYAHHAMGGGMPSTFEQGLISGFAHPVIGFDHLAFILGIGAASAFLRARFILPLVFIAATLVGCVLQLQGNALPFAEIVIAGSVVLVGVLIVSGANVPSALPATLFGTAGLFHGWAYGGSILGAEQTPLLAYLLGFSLIQAAIALTAMAATRMLWHSAGAVPLRISGGVIVGVGATFFLENIEKLVFPGIV